MKYLICRRLKAVTLLVLAGFALNPVFLSGCVGFKNESRRGAESEGAGGLYEGTAQGYRGVIRVRVGLTNGEITEITVIESREDRAVGAAAMEELTDMVLFYNTTEVDAVSGATETSGGFLRAIENAIMNR